MVGSSQVSQSYQSCVNNRVPFPQNASKIPFNELGLACPFDMGPLNSSKHMAVKERLSVFLYRR